MDMLCKETQASKGENSQDSDSGNFQQLTIWNSNSLHKIAYLILKMEIVEGTDTNCIRGQRSGEKRIVCEIIIVLKRKLRLMTHTTDAQEIHK